jgi:hypothetical protein
MSSSGEEDLMVGLVLLLESKLACMVRSTVTDLLLDIMIKISHDALRKSAMLKPGGQGCPMLVK